VLLLIFGEAGIGKSSLVRALRGLLPANGRLLVGHCDDLGTPRTLGPFRDLVDQVGAELTRALAEGGERDAVLAAFPAELDWAGHPTVLVVEDVHWADEATLDVLGYLARRIAGLPAVLVLTYRDDELTREHPLQQFLGQASASGRVHRLPLRRLSEDAVRWLSATSRVDAGRVFAMTSGNPFFVAEVLATGDGDRVPSTVADAVLARVRRLDPATQDALEQLAVVPSVVERWLVDALVAGGLAALAAAEPTLAGRRLAGGLGELGELALAFEKHRPCHIASIAGDLTRDHGSADLIIHQTGLDPTRSVWTRLRSGSGMREHSFRPGPMVRATRDSNPQPPDP
jgi:energy-coupling factor transporter ATP-binding protein EcfA2